MNEHFIAEAERLPVAYWQLYSVPEKTLFALSGDGRISGFITPESFPAYSHSALGMKVSDIMRLDVKTVRLGGDLHMQGRNVIADFPSIKLIPVLDSQNKPAGLLKRWQLFFKDEFFKAVRSRDPVEMPYPQYAAAIWRAADVAQAVGVKRISVLEFGVAQGAGLLACEELAEPIERAWGVEIDVYGFDGASGLPEGNGWRDCPQCWQGGLFPMDEEKLRGRLRRARLIQGPIADTWPAFLAGGHSPVGAMLIDVDYYSSTVPILAGLERGRGNFLPIVNMCFDDIGGSLQFQGEALAIKEFNQRNAMIKISPEEESFGDFNFGGRRRGFSKLKACMFYGHPLFTASGFRRKIMHDFWR